jgi:helix-turn-helix protein
VQQQPQRLWGVREVAEFLGVPVATLYQWRYQGYGPPGARVGRTSATTRKLSRTGSVRSATAWRERRWVFSDLSRSGQRRETGSSRNYVMARALA